MPGRNNPHQQRLEPQPGEAIDRSDPVEFEFDGRRVQGFRGDTVASAVYAAGTRVFSRSFKYHRPRGILCCAAACPNCLVSAGGEPNVRACARAVEPGLEVRSQNAWPSLGFDLLSLLDQLHWLMPVGFYYKALHRPKALWLLARRVIRRVGGLGSIDVNATFQPEFSSRNLHVDVAVVGGGPAGIAASLAAADAGARVALIDDQPTLGGHLRFSRQPVDTTGGGEGKPGCEMAQELAETIARSPNIETFSNAAAFGLYQGNLVAVLTDEGLIRVRARQVTLATGARESPLLFENNDLPGVMLTSAARRLITLYGIRPGREAVVAIQTPNGSEDAYEAALELLDAGVRVAAVVDASETASGEAAEAVRRRGVTILTGHRVVRAAGRGSVKAALITPVGDVNLSAVRKIRCDLLCMSSPFQPVDALLHQADASRPGVTMAGGVNGARGLDEINRQGWDAGARAAGASLANSPSLSADVPPIEPATSTLPAVPPGKGRTHLRLFLRRRFSPRHRAGHRRGLRRRADIEAVHHGHHGAVPGEAVRGRPGRHLRGLRRADNPFIFAAGAQRRRILPIHQPTRGGDQSRFPYRRIVHHFEASLSAGAAGRPRGARANAAQADAVGPHPPRFGARRW